MRCETCQGSGERRVISGEFVGWRPCPDCNGFGVSHCCDGLQEQPETSEETVRRLGALTSMSAADVLDCFNWEQRDPGDETPTGCADDCCHPSHGHARLRFAPHDYVVPQAVIDSVTGDLPAAEVLVSEMKAGRYRIECVDASEIENRIDNLWRRHDALQETKRKWWRALSDPIAWPSPDEPDTHDEWRKLNDE